MNERCYKFECKAIVKDLTKEEVEFLEANWNLIVKDIDNMMKSKGVCSLKIDS